MSRNTDIAFMSELAAAAQLRPRLSASLLLFAVIAFFVWAVIWASFSEIEEVTRGSGQVVPSSELQIVQSLEGGLLAEMAVREGEFVEQGQLLLRIDDVLFASEEGSLRAELTGLRAAEIRRNAEADGTLPVFPADLVESAPAAVAGEQALFETRASEKAAEAAILTEDIASVRAEIAEGEARLSQLARAVELADQELAINRRLVERGAVPEVKLLELERALNEAAGGRAALTERLVGLRAELAAAERRLEQVETKFRADAQTALTEIRTRIASLEARLTSSEDRVRRTELRAPVSGVVQRILVNTIGGVVQPAMPLVEIVPAEDELIVRARVRPSDIAFIQPGQEVRVKITAYDSQIYGSIPGTLERISADAVSGPDGQLYFEVDVLTERTFLGADEARLPIIPGMIAEIDVITGKRTIMSYLLSPILRAGDRALREA